MPKKPKQAKRLTTKQRAFVEAVASGDHPTQVEAYLAAGYSSEGERKTAREAASRLANNSNIAATIEERTVAIGRESALGMIASRRYVLRRLREEADDPASPASARIAALSLLAKASGALDDASDRESKRSSATEADLLSELEARLRTLAPELLASDVEELVTDAPLIEAADFDTSTEV